MLALGIFHIVDFADYTPVVWWDIFCLFSVFVKRGLDLDPIWVPFFFLKQEYFIDIGSNIGVENIQLENKIIDRVSPKAESHSVWKGIVSLHPSLIWGLTPPPPRPGSSHSPRKPLCPLCSTACAESFLAPSSLLMLQCSVNKAFSSKHCCREHPHLKAYVRNFLATNYPQKVCFPWGTGKLFIDKINHVINIVPFSFSSQEAQSHKWGTNLAMIKDYMAFTLVF